MAIKIDKYSFKTYQQWFLLLLKLIIAVQNCDRLWSFVDNNVESIMFFYNKNKLHNRPWASIEFPLLFTLKISYYIAGVQWETKTINLFYEF